MSWIHFPFSKLYRTPLELSQGQNGFMVVLEDPFFVFNLRTFNSNCSSMLYGECLKSGTSSRPPMWVQRPEELNHPLLSQAIIRAVSAVTWLGRESWIGAYRGCQLSILLSLLCHGVDLIFFVFSFIFARGIFMSHEVSRWLESCYPLLKPAWLQGHALVSISVGVGGVGFTRAELLAEVLCSVGCCQGKKASGQEGGTYSFHRLMENEIQRRAVWKSIFKI